MEIAEERLRKYNDSVKTDLDGILNPKFAEKTLKLRIDLYTKPGSCVVAGIAFTCIFAVIAPFYGWFIMAAMNAINASVFEEKNVLDESQIWIILMAVGAAVIGLTKAISYCLLARVTENVITGVRSDLYRKIIQKDIGWHDHNENSASVMTSTLASDVQLLKGIGTEGLSAKIEGIVALLTALILTGVFSWPMLLVGLACTPFILICGAL